MKFQSLPNGRSLSPDIGTCNTNRGQVNQASLYMSGQCVDHGSRALIFERNDNNVRPILRQSYNNVHKL